MSVSSRAHTAPAPVTRDIEPWLVDQELIRRASAERPSWHWVFIGNRSRGLEIENLPNVHFLPPVPYDELPRYAAGFDVCVLPWETAQSFTSYGSAIKVREYLATGKPVVIAALPEYEPMADVLRIARSRDDFLRLVEEALGEARGCAAPTPGSGRQRPPGRPRRMVNCLNKNLGKEGDV